MLGPRETGSFRPAELCGAVYDPYDGIEVLS